MADLTDSIAISSSGLKVQTARLKIVSQNLSNADSISTTPGGMPYQRKTISFKNVFDKETGAELVKVNKLGTDSAPPISRYEPNSPYAGPNGIVMYPNISKEIETVDMKEAQRSYEANLNMIDASKAMIGETLNLIK